MFMIVLSRDNSQLTEGSDVMNDLLSRSGSGKQLYIDAMACSSGEYQREIKIVSSVAIFLRSLNDVWGIKCNTMNTRIGP